MSTDDEENLATKFTVSRRYTGHFQGKSYTGWERITITEINFDGTKWTASHEWSTDSYGYPVDHSRTGRASTLPQAIENLYRALNSEDPDWGNDLTVETP